jgi:nicotinamidase/pyrazinamidase
MSQKSNDLLIIDPQIDFCRPGDINSPERGALYVDNAEKDMARVAQFIRNFGSNLRHIHVTLDCHHLFDVAHPQMWRNSKGENPHPFTIFGSKEIKNGEWLPVFPQLTQRFIDYCESLEKTGKFPLCIWPPHCLIGSEGNAIIPVLYEVLVEWQMTNRRNINFVSKGSNPFTEHYSAIKAEVADPNDPTTQINTRLIQVIMDSDMTFIAGEAGSHCLKSTIEDIVEGFEDDSYVKKLFLLEDCTSPVSGFEQSQIDFIRNMTQKGMNIATSSDF